MQRHGWAQVVAELNSLYLASASAAPAAATAGGRLASNRTASLRVLLAEDDAAIAQDVVAEITRFWPGSMVERAETEERFESALRGFAPDVVLVDDALPWVEVRTALSSLHEVTPAAPLIVLSRACDEDSIVGDLRAGAEDIVLTSNLHRLGRVVASALSVRSPLRKLSPRQLDVLRMIAAGHTTPRIANQLDRSPKTIETHRSEIMRRLGIHDVVGLVRYAIRVGLAPREVQTG
jgi:DNA-binding NarL/FixJ family response regulator